MRQCDDLNDCLGEPAPHFLRHVPTIANRSSDQTHVRLDGLGLGSGRGEEIEDIGPDAGTRCQELAPKLSFCPLRRRLFSKGFVEAFGAEQDRFEAVADGLGIQCLTTERGVCIQSRDDGVHEPRV